MPPSRFLVACLALACCSISVVGANASSSRRLLAGGAAASTQAATAIYCHWNEGKNQYSDVNKNRFNTKNENGHVGHANDCCRGDTICSATPTGNQFLTCGPNVLDSPACACKTGYTGLYCASDINECATNNGGCAQNCTNTAGSFVCSCTAGFALAADGKACSDINACLAYPCAAGAANATCADKAAPAANSTAGRTCTCPPGYYYTGEEEGCQDINPCLSTRVANPQNDLAVCVAGAAEATCTDKNATGQAGSPAGGASGRTCTCPTGYAYNETTGCQDIDECAADTDGCAQNCTNTAGSFVCSCTAGFVLAADGKNCSDIDACLAFACAAGAANATCADNPAPAANSTSGRNCTCPPGYYYTGEEEGCQDINPCLANKVPDQNDLAVCVDGAANATCTDKNATGQAGSPAGGASGRTCTCPTGYAYNETTGCQDIDECTLDTDGCAQNCTNTAGSFVCSCGDGYSLNEDGKACDDIDACLAFACAAGAANATCADNPAPAANSTAGRNCTCPPGYYYTGEEEGCQDINPCLANRVPDQNDLAVCVAGAAEATCTDKNATGQAGSPAGGASGRTCTCPTGYAYNETTGCQDINACINNQCTAGTGTAICTDKPAPALDNADGRNCTCVAVGATRYFYSGDTNGCTACKPNGEGNNNSGSNGAGSDCANPGGYDETCCSFTCGNNGVCVAAGTSIGNGNGGHNGGSNGGNNGGGNPKLLGKR